MIIIGIQTKKGFTKASAFKVMPFRNNMFRVQFENGYENIFYTDVETGAWIEEDLGYTQLAALVGEQINKSFHYPVHVPKILTWQYYQQDLGNKIFGYYNYKMGGCNMFEIYNSNKKYLFTLSENHKNEWQILVTNFNKMCHLNLDLLSQVTSALSMQDI